MLSLKRKEKATGFWAGLLSVLKIIGLTLLIFLGMATVLVLLLVLLRNLNLAKRRKRKREELETKRRQTPLGPDDLGKDAP